jgi:hypothetical protein
MFSDAFAQLPGNLDSISNWINTVNGYATQVTLMLIVISTMASSCSVGTYL